jgi:hypothetical protein
MRKPAVFWLVLVALVPVSTSAQNQASQGGATVVVEGPLIVGFFPPFTRAEEEANDSGIAEGLAHVRFALDDIAACYANTAAIYRLDVTRSVTLREGRTVRRITLPSDRNHAVGIIFAMPGRQHRIVFAQDGPSSLSVAGPSAAAEYFGAQACSRKP